LAAHNKEYFRFLLFLARSFYYQLFFLFVTKNATLAAKIRKQRKKLFHKINSRGQFHQHVQLCTAFTRLDPKSEK